MNRQRTPGLRWLWWTMSLFALACAHGAVAIRSWPRGAVCLGLTFAACVVWVARVRHLGPSPQAERRWWVVWVPIAIVAGVGLAAAVDWDEWIHAFALAPILFVSWALLAPTLGAATVVRLRGARRAAPDPTRRAGR